MSQYSMISGSDLKFKLKKKGISSVDICRGLGYNKTTVSRYFTNDMAMPATFIVKVAAFANLNINDLIQGHIEPNTIDIDHTDVAAEAPEPYTTIALPPPPATRQGSTISTHATEPAPPPPAPLVTIDISALDHALTDLRHKVTAMEQELHRIRQELELVNH